MIISYNWLKELINLNVSYEKLVEELSLYSCEVETSNKMVSATNLVVGEVLTCVPHENSDHLHVCTVNIGDKVSQIVCGAPNVQAGEKVIVALPGAVLPGGTIKESKVRGVESLGMLCSLQELGIENKYVPAKYQNGIYLLDKDAPVGMDALKYLCLDDYLIELSLTPNRMDLMSMLGVCHDVKAMYHVDINPLECEFNETSEKTADEISVKINTEECYSYYARIVKDVEIKESPNFIKSRLIACGVRPINNVVDITNYVLMLFGQPLHSFDQDKLGKTIIIRNAKDGEEIVTLDDQKRILNANDVVISDDLDNNRAVCLAGVMGGKSTEVTSETKNLVLESAVFAPLTIRKTSSRLGLRSESSVRYERGVDLNNSLNAVNYACYLLEKYANGKVSKGFVHAGISEVEDTLISITPEQLKKYLGIEIPWETVKEICILLDFKVEEENGLLKVYVPNRRLDVKILPDLIEEIARIYGYDKLNETLPLMRCEGYYSKKQMIEKVIASSLVNLGFNETISYSLVSSKLSKLFKILLNGDEEDITLLHPMTEEHSILRKSLVPSLLEIIAYNNNRKISDLSIFEMGKRYYMKNGKPVEEMICAGAVQGIKKGVSWKGQNDKVDFFYLKGALENVFENLHVNVKYEKLVVDENCKDVHPGRSAWIVYNEQRIGYIAEIHPTLQKEYDVDEVYVFEFLVDALYEKDDAVIKFEQISKVPAVERDLALVMEESIPVGDVIQTIYKSDKKLIKSVEVFDVYQGEHIEQGYKSVAVRITLEPEDTLTEDEINAKIKRVLGTLAYMYKIELRK